MSERLSDERLRAIEHGERFEWPNEIEEREMAHELLELRAKVAELESDARVLRQVEERAAGNPASWGMIVGWIDDARENERLAIKRAALGQEGGGDE